MNHASKAAILYANLKGNLGDFAILHSMLRRLERDGLGTGVDLYAHSTMPVDEPRFEAFAANAPLPVRMAGRVCYDAAAPAAVFSTFGPARWIAHALQERRNRAAALRQVKFLAQYERIEVAGGQQWNGYPGKFMLGTVAALAGAGAQVRAASFSVNDNIADFSTRRFIASGFNALQAPLPARNQDTVNTLGSLGFDVRFEPDTVYALGGEVAGISPRPGRDGARILLSLTSRNKAGIREMDAFLARCRKDGANVAMLTTCAVEDEPIYRELCGRHGIECLLPLTWEDAVAEMKSCALLITNRLHGIILGSLAGAPILPLSDRGKVRSYVADNAGCVHAARLSEIDEAVLAQARAIRHVWEGGRISLKRAAAAF